MWTLAAREQQFKSQFIQFALEKLPDLEFPLALGIRQQIHSELTTMLGVACGTVEATSDDLKIELSKMEDEIENLEEATSTASILIERSQDIQYNIEKLSNDLLCISSCCQTFVLSFHATHEFFKFIYLGIDGV